MRTAIAAAALILFSCSPAGPGGVQNAGSAVWPRFPADPLVRGERTLAVLYSTGNLGPRTTLAQLGYPGRNIFRLHEDHPQLHVVLMSCPANRYSGEGTVLDSKDASATWRMLALDPRFDWLELGNQGYTHSPPDDTDLNHHEFSLSQTGCNVAHTGLDDPGYVTGRFDLIRGAYRSLEIPDERVVLLRFPGMTAGPRALAAAAQAGFVASLGSSLIKAPDQGELVEIPDTRILRKFAQSDPLEKALANGRLKRETVAESEEMKGAVALGVAVAEEAARGGGILNLSDVWNETFAFIGGTYPRYLILDAVLDAVEERYRGRIWFPQGRELALWLALVRDARVEMTAAGDGYIVTIVPTEGWTRVAGEGLAEASLIVGLPAAVESVSAVRIRADGEEEWRDIASRNHWMERRGLAVVFPIRGSVELQITPG